MYNYKPCYHHFGSKTSLHSSIHLLSEKIISFVAALKETK